MRINRLLLTIATLTAGLNVCAQVVTELGRANMRIPRGERPEAVQPPVSNNYHIDTDTASAYYVLVDSAQTCARLERWQAAEQWLRKAIALEPANAANALLLSNLGTVQRRRGRLDDALKSYNLALDLTPNAVTVLLNRAALLLEQGSLAAAEADFERVRTLDPDDEESRYSLGMIAVERGDYRRAEALFAEMRNANPRSSMAQEGLGLLRKAQGEHGMAIEHFSAALAAGDDPRLLAHRADCLLTQQRLTEAADDIVRALELAPDDGFLYLLRAKLNKMRWNQADAERDIGMAVQHGVDRATAENLLK